MWNLYRNGVRPQGATVTCSNCGQEIRIGSWPFCPDHGFPLRRQCGAAHPKERAVIYRGPNGQVSFPMRNDLPMPENLQKWGYVREELPSLQDVRRIEREAGVQSEIAEFDRGSGRADYEPETPKIDMTGLEFSREP